MDSYAYLFSEQTVQAAVVLDLSDTKVLVEEGFLKRSWCHAGYLGKAEYDCISFDDNLIITIPLIQVGDHFRLWL